MPPVVWLLTRVSMATGIPEAFTKTGMGISAEEASNAIFPTAIVSLIANFALCDASVTRLRAAVRARSYRDFVKVLKTEAPYIDARNESVETALHVATKLCSSWHSGPTRGIEDEKGRTPFDVACEHDREGSANLLWEGGRANPCIQPRGSC